MPRTRSLLALLTALFTLLISAAARPVGAQTILLSEDFDAADMPSGWTADPTWSVSSSSASSGSGAGNLAHTGATAGDVVTPVFGLLTPGDLRVEYLARRTSSYPDTAVEMALVAGDGSEYALTGPAMPAEASTWTAVAVTMPAETAPPGEYRLRIRGLGGSSSGSNVRIDDVRISSATGSDTTSTLVFGGSPPPILSGSTGHMLPVGLSWAGVDPLQGVQFRVALSGPVSWVGVQRAGPTLDLAAWQLESETDSTGVRILLVHNGVSGLAASMYPEVLGLVVDAYEVADTVAARVTISDVVGATSVPTGADAGLGGSGTFTDLAVIPLIGVFEAPDSLDVGQVPAGEAHGFSIPVHNAGTAILGITAAEVDSTGSGADAFVIDPDPFSLSPGETVDVAGSFVPPAGAAGRQVATVTFHLDTGGVARVVVTGEATTSRGDASADGAVDVVDIVLAIDAVLGRVGTFAAERADLYPFPSGDGTMDVRDVTVLIHAVLSGAWPDGVPLPSAGAAASRTAQEAAIQTWLSGGSLFVDIGRPVRGLQVVLPGSDDVPRPAADLAAATGSGLQWWHGDPGARGVWAPVDGQALGPGVYRLATGVPASTRPAVMAAGMDRDRLLASHRVHPPVSRSSAPYPNPFDPRRDGLLSIPGASSARVFDVLGRLVWKGVPPWPGTGVGGATVAPGIYMVEGHDGAHPVVVR